MIESREVETATIPGGTAARHEDESLEAFSARVARLRAERLDAMHAEGEKGAESPLAKFARVWSSDGA